MRQWPTIQGSVVESPSVQLLSVLLLPGASQPSEYPCSRISLSRFDITLTFRRCVLCHLIHEEAIDCKNSVQVDLTTHLDGNIAWLIESIPAFDAVRKTLVAKASVMLKVLERFRDIQPAAVTIM